MQTFCTKATSQSWAVFSSLIQLKSAPFWSLAMMEGNPTLCSIHWATVRSFLSWRAEAISCKPIGRPRLDKAVGTETAGRPTMKQNMRRQRSQWNLREVLTELKSCKHTSPCPHCSYSLFYLGKEARFYTWVCEIFIHTFHLLTLSVGLVYRFVLFFLYLPCSQAEWRHLLVYCEFDYLPV